MQHLWSLTHSLGLKPGCLSLCDGHILTSLVLNLSHNFMENLTSSVLTSHLTAVMYNYTPVMFTHYYFLYVVFYCIDAAALWASL